MFGLYIAESGAAEAFGHIDVDISEAGEGWGDEDIIIDEGQSTDFFSGILVINIITGRYV